MAAKPLIGINTDYRSTRKEHAALSFVAAGYYDGITAAGERVFSVSINGKPALKDLDVFKEAGGLNKPLVKECKDVQVTDGKLVIGFTAQTQNPEINGIEVLGQ